MHEEETSANKKKWWKIIRITVGLLLFLMTAAVIAAVFFWNSLLGRITDAAETTLTIETAPELTEMYETEPTAPEETWPSVVSDETITNLMLVGHNYRDGEEHRLSDTMILCSLNRETQTLSLVSVLRDLYVPLPAYAGHGPGRNRINVCYHLGSQWVGKPEGGMEMLALCLEQNFGIPVDHTIEVNFDAFVEIIDILGGVDVELTEAEARYLTRHVGYVGDFEPGWQTLDGTQALAYARIRKIDSDNQRTARQRTVITSLLDKCRKLGLMELYELAKTVLPKITTDMSNQEITNYVWEILPMLKNLQIRSITCPVDNGILTGSQWGEQVEIGGTPSSVIKCNIRLNRKYLLDYLGLEEKTQ